MDIMQAIMEIENTARGIADSAQQLKENHETQLQDEIDRRRQEMEQRVAAQLEQIRLRMDAERQERMERLESVYEGKLEQLDKKSKANRDKWIEKIAKAVLAS